MNFKSSFRRAAASVRNFSKSSSDFQPSSLWITYNRYLTEKPVLTKSITSGVIAFLGDIACQKYFTQEKEPKMDWKRTFKFTLLGTALVGPLLHYWYGFLVTKIPGTTAVSTLYRVAFDQLLFAPFCILPAFFSASMVLNGTPEQIPDKLKADWFPTVIANFALWVPAQFINFKFMPPQYQVLFANVVGLFWNVYLSAATNKAVEAHAPLGPEGEMMAVVEEEVEYVERVFIPVVQEYVEENAPQNTTDTVLNEHPDPTPESLPPHQEEAPKEILGVPSRKVESTIPEDAHLSESTPDNTAKKLPSKKIV